MRTCVPSASRRSRAHPLRYVSGVGRTTFEELWKPLFVALPSTGAATPSDAQSPSDASKSGNTTHASGPDGRRGDPRRPSGVLLDHAGRAHPRALDVARGSLARLRDAGDAAQVRRDGTRCERPAGRGAALHRERVAHASVQPVVEALPTTRAVARRGARRCSVLRRPQRSGLAIALAAAAALVVGLQALAIYTIIEFAVPVAPAFLVLGAAGLVGTRTPTGRRDERRFMRG